MVENWDIASDEWSQSSKGKSREQSLTNNLEDLEDTGDREGDMDSNENEQDESEERLESIEDTDEAGDDIPDDQINDESW